MRKFFLSLSLILPLLASCSLPALNQAATPDLVGTQVSINLTSSPIGPQATVPAATVAPTQTSQPATPTPEATTPAATETVTPTGQPSPTLPSTDPAASLGNPTWKDTFSDGKTWGLETPYDDGNTRVEVSNNSLILTSAAAKGWHGWRVSFKKPADNFYLEAIVQTQTCAANDTYGLIFRMQDSGGAYWFNLTCDGHYSLLAGDGGTFSEVIKSATNPALLAGSNQTNRLGVMVKGNQISLYANGKPLGQATDSTYANPGTFGYFIAGQKTINFTIVSTQIQYWDLP